MEFWINIHLCMDDGESDYIALNKRNEEEVYG